MEPLRPLVDIVAYGILKEEDFFKPEHRRQLVNILNMKINYRNKKMYLCNMIENYIEQFVALIMDRSDKIIFPDVLGVEREEYGEI